MPLLAWSPLALLIMTAEVRPKLRQPWELAQRP
jgi:hypothetical protein